MRPFQDVLIDLGARLGPAGLRRRGRQRRATRRATPTTSSTTSAARASARSPAGAARTASEHGRGAPNPEQLERYVENGCFWQTELPPEQRYFKHANHAYLDYRGADGLHRRRRADRLPALLRAAAAASASPPQGHGAGRSRRSSTARASRPISTRCRSGTRRSRTRTTIPPRFPLHAITQRPMAMYHSWDSQNAWLRQIHGSNRLYHATGRRRAALGLADDDWVWIASRARPGQGAAPADGRASTRTRSGPGTRSASGAGAWKLAADAPEATKGFLAEPPDRRAAAASARAATATPTPTRSPGQAAWYDLRVRLSRRARRRERGISAPQFAIAAAAGAASPPRPEMAALRRASSDAGSGGVR